MVAVVTQEKGIWKDFNLASNILCHTLSTAFQISKAIRLTMAIRRIKFQTNELHEIAYKTNVVKVIQVTGTLFQDRILNYGVEQVWNEWSQSNG